MTRHQNPSSSVGKPRLYTDLMDELQRRKRIEDDILVRRMIVPPPKRR